MTHDIVGYFDRFAPKFVKKYANISDNILGAVEQFKEEIQSGVLPDDGHSFTSEKG